MSDFLLEARDLRKGYGRGENRIEVLRGITLGVKQGEMIAIIGPSGSGKTTLLQILGTLDQPDSGSVLYEGQPLNGLNEAALNRHRNQHVGFIFQFHHLLPEFTALENVMMPGKIGKVPSGELRLRAAELLDQVGLGHRLDHRPAELSGGEQQRVALARALVMRPALLLADEPTGNLDIRNGQRVFSLLQELCDQLRLSVILVTHNLDLAARLDNTLRLLDGRLG